MMVGPRPAPVLRLERVSKIYPTGEVLRDVTWEVKPGDRIGLVGVADSCTLSVGAAPG